MGERKVLNKYFPPDFDPSKLPKGKRPDYNSMKVRMMLPMSVRCNTCGNFMYKGTKFNCKKQDVENETYLGIPIVRFYYRCAACAAEFIMKTDPQNTDYVMERGATRNYEPWREKEKDLADAVAEREEEERGNAMKALENRTLDSKREMDVMGALDELQSMNRRHEGVTTEDALAALQRSANNGEDELNETGLDPQDQASIRNFVLQQKQQVRRLEDSPPREDYDRAPVSISDQVEPERTNFRIIRKPTVKIVKKQKVQAAPGLQNTVSENGSAVVSKQENGLAKEDQNGHGQENALVTEKQNGHVEAEMPSTGLIGLLGGYGSDSE